MHNRKSIFLFIFLIIIPIMNPIIGDIKYYDYNGSANHKFAINYNTGLSDEEFPWLTATNMSTTLGVEEMWNMGINGSGVKVAVIDTGIDDTHAELSGQIIYGKSFVEGTESDDPMDYEGHGTVVAGIIASKGVGSGQYKGIAPGVQLMNIKVMNGTGSGYLEWVVDGIEDAVDQGANILSISLGADPSGWAYIQPVITSAWEKGVIIVTASGNEGPYFDTISTPGDVLEAITVGSSSIDFYMMSFSSSGPTRNEKLCKPELVTPGAYIIGPASSLGTYYDFFEYDGNEYAALSGTSVSTPVVSGMAALLYQATKATNNAIKVALMKSAIDMDYSPYRQGYGVPSAIEAYRLLIEPEWEPVLFLPDSTPKEPIDIENVYEYPITIITGKKYEDVYLETDLPLILPDIDEIDGHYTFELEPDLTTLEQESKAKGYVRLMDEDDEVLATLHVEIIPVNVINIISLIITAVFVAALSSVATFIVFNFVLKRKKDLIKEISDKCKLTGECSIEECAIDDKFCKQIKI